MNILCQQDNVPDESKPVCVLKSIGNTTNNTMSNEHNSKKMRFNEENLEECERQIMLQHDRAMGYATRLSPVRNVLHIAMEVFKPPPSIMPIMETFRA